MTTQRVTSQWTDASGNAAGSKFFVDSGTSDTTISGVLEKMDALSDLQLVSAYKQTDATYAGTDAATIGSGHAYADNRAAMILSFGPSSYGEFTHLSIPGPKEAAYIGNNFRVDITSSSFDTLKAAVAAAVVTQSNNAPGSLHRGVVRVRKGPRTS